MEQGTLAERLQILRERFYIMAPALLLVFATASADAPRLAWTAMILLVLLTVNWIVPHLR